MTLGGVYFFNGKTFRRKNVKNLKEKTQKTTGQFYDQ